MSALTALTRKSHLRLGPQLRRQWMARALPCSRCGRPIDYAGGRFLPSGKINKNSFVLGHKRSSA